MKPWVYVRRLKDKDPEAYQRIKAIKEAVGVSWAVAIKKFYGLEEIEKAEKKGAIKRKLKEHNQLVLEKAKELSEIGFKTVVLMNPIPDAVVIDFNARKVYALEVDDKMKLNQRVSHALIEKYVERGYDDVLEYELKEVEKERVTSFAGTLSALGNRSAMKVGVA